MAEFDKSNNSNKVLHIVMFPWLAMGHITPFIHLANELAKRGHSVTILLPQKAILKLGHHNLYPHLIKFHTLTVPHVDGLPPGAETASDVAPTNDSFYVAFDAMSHQVETLLSGLKPDIVIFDLFAYWITKLAPQIGFKTVLYVVVAASCVAYNAVPRTPRKDGAPLMGPPEGYPSSTVVFTDKDMWTMSFIAAATGKLGDAAMRLTAATRGCDAIAIRSCREVEGPMCDYILAKCNKRVLLSGPILSAGTPKGGSPLEEKWDSWLSKFTQKTVVFCAFGSQLVLQKDQFQEMLLGFEMTGLPFFIALSKPDGVDSIEEALPEGFVERVGGRGVVHGGWVQQTHILNHPSVGCFVSHCGFGSMWESLLSDSQIVVVPHLPDQLLNARLLAAELKVAVEVERGEKGWVSKEDLCKAIKCVMDEDSEVGKVMMHNHAKWKETLGSQEFSDNYINNFIQELHQL